MKYNIFINNGRGTSPVISEEFSSEEEALEWAKEYIQLMGDEPSTQVIIRPVE